MHVVLGITAAHDRYLGMPATESQRFSETYHSSRCAALFNEKLSQPVGPQDRDPLWATGSLLSILAVASVEASMPEDAFPLKASEPSDLDWLRISEGKMALWNLTDPLRPGSMFRVMSDEYARLFSPVPSVGMDGIPSALCRLCHLNAISTADNNPYSAAVHTVAQLQMLPSSQVTGARSLAFVSHMQNSFKCLLQEKDPIALLIMALWYTKVRGAVWWMDRRASVESQSICLYLQRYHRSNTAVQELLPLGSDLAI
jgi:hypothetical protein